MVEFFFLVIWAVATYYTWSIPIIGWLVFGGGIVVIVIWLINRSGGSGRGGNFFADFTDSVFDIFD